MPPTVPAAQSRFMQRLGGAMNQVAGMASQQSAVISSADGQMVINEGVLQQYPASGSPTNFTSGYGLEILSDGAGSAPSVRAGLLNWTSPGGGTVSVVGVAFFDSSGNLRVLWSVSGAQVFDTSGNLIGYVPYFNAGSFVGEITF